MGCRIILTCLLISSITLWAAEGRNVLTLSPEVQRGDIYKPQGLWPLLGVGLGVMDHNDTTRTGGVPGHVKVLGSYYFVKAPLVADLGLGLHNHFLSQVGPGSDTIQSLYTEIAGRYVFTNRWQLGAIWNTLIDNPRRYQSNNDNLATFMGAQALKEFAWSDEYLVRVGGRATTSLGLNGGSINTLMAELEVSFGPGNKAVAVEEKAAQAIAPHLATQAIHTFYLDPKLMHFDSSSTRLVNRSHGYAKRLARVLAQNHHLFERVEVVGHADPRGTDKYNDELSTRRAMAISEKLIAAGVKASQIVTEGKGETQLLTHSMKPASLLMNRRVQLEFQGVKNQQALKNVIDSATR